MHQLMMFSVVIILMVLYNVQGCPDVCVCIWKQGKETVECVNKALITIPGEINPNTQVLDLSGNNFQILPKLAFQRANLGNLQKIFLKSCKLGHIHHLAFAHLTNLVELDLSNNLLTKIPSGTFKDFPLLRRLVLSLNLIQKVESNSFVDISDLKNLDLSNCQIENIDPRAFSGLNYLEYLKLDGNKLYTLGPQAVKPLTSLNGIELYSNPWTCDCKLEGLIRWMTTRNIPYGIPPRCTGPTNVKDRTWDQMNIDKFACTPEAKRQYFTIRAVANENTTIHCKIKGIPEVNITWTHDDRVIRNRSMSEYGRPKYIIHENGEREKTSTLTLISANQADNGTYICTGSNVAGSISTNFTVTVSLAIVDSRMLTAAQMAGIILGVLFIFLIVLGIVCLLSARWRHGASAPRAKTMANKNVNQIKSKGIEAHCVAPVENNKHNMIKENSNFSHESSYGNGNNYVNPETSMNGNAPPINGPYMSPEKTVSNNYAVDISEIRYPTYPRQNSSPRGDNMVAQHHNNTVGTFPDDVIENNRQCFAEVQQRLGCENPAMTSSTYSLDKVRYLDNDIDNNPLRRKDSYINGPELSEIRRSNGSLRDESYGSYYSSPRTPNIRVTNKYLAHMPPSAAHLHMLEIGGGLMVGARDSPDEGYDDEGDEGTEV